MPSIANLFTMPRRLLPVFFLIDTANNEELKNIKHSIINHFMEEVTAVLSEFKYSSSSEIKIAVMEFDTDYRWISENGPVSIEDFHYTGVEYESDQAIIGGKADIRAALVELNYRLSIKEFLDSLTGLYRPIIIWITDGNIVDNYEHELAELYSNIWYKNSYKIGVRVGNDDNIEVLGTIVGNKEAVIETSDLPVFRRLIRDVSITVSMADKSKKDESFDRLVVKLDEVKLCEIKNGDKCSICKCQFTRCEPNEALNTVINIITEDDSRFIKVRHEFNEPVVLVRKGTQSYYLNGEYSFPDLKVKGTAQIEIINGKLYIKTKNSETISSQMLEIKETMEKSKDYILECGDRMELQCGTVYFIDDRWRW